MYLKVYSKSILGPVVVESVGRWKLKPLAFSSKKQVTGDWAEAVSVSLMDVLSLNAHRAHTIVIMKPLRFHIRSVERYHAEFQNNDTNNLINYVGKPLTFKLLHE